MVAKMGAGSSGDAFGPFYRVEGGAKLVAYVKRMADDGLCASSKLPLQ
jgi:hypothetical protein